MKYVPYPYQDRAYRFCLSHDRCGLFLEMGLGKTVVTLSVLADRLWDQYTVRSALVIAPLNVAANVWAQETKKWDHLRDLRCSAILGTAAQRRRALQAKADLYIINRENVVWLMDELGGALPYDMVILDELSSFKNQSAKRWKALRKAIQSVRYVVGLTGTPAPNGYLDLWPQIYLLDGGQRLGRRVTEYRERWFKPGARNGHVIYEWVPRIGAQAAIDRQLKDLCLSMTAEDWLQLPPVIYNVIPVRMDAASRKTYDRLKTEKVIPLLQQGDRFCQLDPRKPEELAAMTSSLRGDTAASIAGKLLQMANGAVYDDEHSVVPVHDAKLDALAEVIGTNPGDSLLVFYNYQHDRDRIVAKFPQARVFSGTKDVEDWNAGRIPLLLCHPASTGHGLNLQHGGHIIVWFGLTWSLELYQQANARLPRPGQTQSVVIHHLVCKDTLDERVMDTLRQRQQDQDALINALKDYLQEDSK